MHLLNRSVGITLVHFVIEQFFNVRRLDISDYLISDIRIDLIFFRTFISVMFDHAKQFASADTIVIAAPYWDLSFPSTLKIYIENIYVTGIVSAYDESGMPVGLCKAKELYYITTAGGPYDPTYSYGYIESLAKNYFGIPKTHLVKAEMLDIIGNDAEEILNQEVSRIFGNAIL